MFSILEPTGLRREIDAAISRAQEKGTRDSYRLYAAPVEQALSLLWILNNRKLVVETLFQELEHQRFVPKVGKENSIERDKIRQIRSYAWLDRLVDSALANRIGEATESRLSDALFSFRSGRSNLTAIESACRWIQEKRAAGQEIFLAKRDITAFGDNIPHAQTLEILKRYLPNQPEYLWELVRQFISVSGTNLSGKGLPTGLALTPVLENIYLTDLDHLFAAHNELYYARFGDDILLMHSDSQELSRAVRDLEARLLALGLQVNSEKTRDLELTDRQPLKQHSKTARNFDYLGFSISFAGQRFLSTRKVSILKREIRAAIRRSYYQLRAHFKERDSQIAALVRTTNLLVSVHARHPYLELMLSQATDSDRIREFDLWLARQTLAPFFGTSLSRVFRRVSLRELRSRFQLASLLDLWNRRYRSDS